MVTVSFIGGGNWSTRRKLPTHNDNNRLGDNMANVVFPNIEDRVNDNRLGQSKEYKLVFATDLIALF